MGTEKEKKHAAEIHGFRNVPKEHEDQLAAAVSIGPVSVAIEADQAGFQHYTSGVFDGKCGTSLDHGVLVVGYSDDYWIVKNSWGKSWGEEGYIRLKRGVDKKGMCGITMQASYPEARRASWPQRLRATTKTPTPTVATRVSRPFRSPASRAASARLHAPPPRPVPRMCPRAPRRAPSASSKCQAPAAPPAALSFATPRAVVAPRVQPVNPSLARASALTPTN